MARHVNPYLPQLALEDTSTDDADPGSDHIKPRPAREAGDILVVYDWECPVCNIYCRLVRVRPTVGQLRLVNARESTVVLEEITKAGLDIDQGMVTRIDGHLYYGADAIHAITLVNDCADLFNWLTHFIFRSIKVSRVLYPCLRTCRNLLLKAMGKTKINNLKIQGNDRF
jgi:predicted DCC family thiol-disulfide oxidoreductase YuxK